MPPGRLLGPASCLGRHRCNDTWALAGTGKLSGKNFCRKLLKRLRSEPPLIGDVAGTLPGRCRDVAGPCRDVAGTLPGRCRDVAETLPGRCRHVAGTLPERCQRQAASRQRQPPCANSSLFKTNAFSTILVGTLLANTCKPKIVRAHTL